MARMGTSRVTKRPASGRMTRARSSRSRLISSAEGSSGSNILQDMVDEVLDPREAQNTRSLAERIDEDEDWDMVDVSDTDVDMLSQESFGAASQSQDKGKGRVKDVKDKPFPLMDLPTEIRLEIYRACLTRPYKVLLSKVEKSPEQGCAVKENTGTNQSEDDDIEVIGIGGYRQPNTLTGLPINSRSTQTSSQAPPTLSSRGRRVQLSSRLRSWTPRSGRQVRLTSSRSSSASGATNTPTQSNSAQSLSNSTTVVTSIQSSSRGTSIRASSKKRPTQDSKSKTEDPLIVNILRTSKEVYKEARDVLYSENVFDLDISTAVTSLAALHQRSRRHIKHVELEIPTYTEILERFSEIVRLSLRYCSGLKKFVIHTPFTLPGADGSMSASNTTVYANGFDILRWLPQQCQVVLQGNHNAEIDAVVNKHLNLAKTQDKVAYARRQLISNEAERPLGA